MNNLQAGLIFDMDGVLADSYRPHYESWALTCAKRGFPFSEEIFDGLFGKSFRAHAEALSTRVLSEAEVLEWYEEKERVYRDIAEKDFPLMAGAVDLIRHLHAQGIRLGVASSGPRGNVDALLRHLPCRDLILATVSADETTRTKPDPEPFVLCAKLIEVPVERCVVIEDSIHGLQAARAAGMVAVGLTTTASAEALHDYTDLTIGALRDMTAERVRMLLYDSHPQACAKRRTVST